ncbi:MAG: hypothetical protein IJG53_08110 [Eggerthellaceae bacterium]|nr:hypothetical protein [Eggerthellaceae bacterium]
MTTLRERICLVLGMTLFLSYFRFQTVIQTLFHKTDVAPFPGGEMAAITAFLLMLVVLAACLAFAAETADRLLDERSVILLIAAAVGSIGAVLNYATGTTNSLIFWISTAFFVAGFLANFISWGHYCSRNFSMEMFWLLALAFILSLALFSVVGVYLPGVKRVLVPLIPLLCEIMWYIASRRPADEGTGESAREDEGEGEGAEAADSLYNPLPKSKLVYILLFATFLLCGSFIRGIVDLQNHYSNVLLFRLYASFILLGGMALYCFFAWRRFKSSLDEPKEGHPAREPLTDAERQAQEDAEGERLTLKCWAFLAVVFCCGLLQAFIFPASDYGGQLVVVARSGLDFLLFVLLCNTVHAERLHPTRIFVMFSVFVEIVSWLISYTLIPGIYAMGVTDPERVVEIGLILIMFLLVTALTILFAWIALRRQSVFDKTPAEEAAAKTRETLPETLAGKYKLTSREVEVMSLFAQGYSLSKVSQELYISLGTAQSHIKNIYRKLDVHSKDELIALIDSWKGER